MEFRCVRPGDIVRGGSQPSPVHAQSVVSLLVGYRRYTDGLLERQARRCRGFMPVDDEVAQKNGGDEEVLLVQGVFSWSAAWCLMVWVVAFILSVGMGLLTYTGGGIERISEENLGLRTVDPGCLPPFRVKIGITFADGAPVQEALNTFFQVVASDTDSQVIVLRCLAHMLKQTMPSLPGSRLQDAMGLFQKLRALQTLARTGLCDMMAEPVAEEAPRQPQSEARSYTAPDLSNLEEISHHFQRSTSDETGGPSASKLRSVELGIAAGGREGFHTGPTGKEESQVAAIADLYRSNRTALKFSKKTATGPEALVDSKARRKSYAGKTSSTLGSMPTISELPEMETQERVPTDDT
eukprot:s6288_g1.t1